LSCDILSGARKRTTKSWTLPTAIVDWLCNSMSTFYGHRGASK